MFFNLRVKFVVRLDAGEPRTRSNQKVSTLIRLIVNRFEYDLARAVLIQLYVLGKYTLDVDIRLKLSRSASRCD